MSKVDLSNMTIHQLTLFYNRYSATPRRSFSTREEAEECCTRIFELLVSNERTQKMVAKVHDHKSRPQTKETLKLDRSVICLTTGEVWGNVYQIWRANPDWLTLAQRNLLTKKLYTAAKNGQHLIISVGGRDYMLTNPPPLKPELKTEINQTLSDKGVNA